MGISSIVLSLDEKHLYMTDSGSFAETSIQNPRGSLYEIDIEDSHAIRPVIYKRLAYPTGLAMNSQGDLLYLCETFNNRILRVFVGDEGNYVTSVFH